MKRLAGIVGALSLVAVIGVAGVHARAYIVANRKADSAIARWRDHQDRVRQIQALQASMPRWTQLRPSEGLAPRVTDALAGCGLPPGMLVSVVAGPESAVRTVHAAGIQRRSAAITLAPISMPDLGRVLSAWKIRESAWIVASINLVAVSDSVSAGAASAKERPAPLRAVLTIESLSLKDPGVAS